MSESPSRLPDDCRKDASSACKARPARRSLSVFRIGGFSLAQSRRGETVVKALMSLIAVSEDAGVVNWDGVGSGEAEEGGPWREEAVLASLIGRHLSGG